MTSQQLLATLTAVADDASITFEDGRYLDWSVSEDDGSRYLEVGENIDDSDAAAVCIRLSRSELLRLHAALTKTLLRMAE